MSDESEEIPPQPTDLPRRKGLSPELRRFMDTPRPRPPEAPPVEAPTVEAAPVKVSQQEDASPPEVRRPTPERMPSRGPVATVSANVGEASEARGATGMLRPDQKASRVPEVQKAILILGALLLLGLTFYVGMKFPYLRYKYLTSQQKTPPVDDPLAAKFPGISSDELVRQALEAERAGKTKEAAERFVAAKYKNPAYRGIMLRVGRMAYDQKDFATADKFFERSIAFGENVDVANHYRGLIALQRKDYPAALRSFLAATEAEPFMSDYWYQVGETLRLDHRPGEALPHYEHAARLARGRGEAAVCRVKARLARMEAGEGAKVREEVAAQTATEPLTVEWLMTDAALRIREGDVEGALVPILLARERPEPGVYATCVSDWFFVEAAQKQPRLSQAVRGGPSRP